MHDVSEYLQAFFMGPYQDRRTAILAVASRHGEKSMVVTENGEAWYCRCWPEENFHPHRWPENFELVSRFDVGVMLVMASPMRFIKSQRPAAGNDDFDFDFDINFANWMTKEDFDVRLPNPNEDFGGMAVTSANDEEMFFRLLSRRDPK